MASGTVPGSFRDPGGFLFRGDGVLYRQVNRCSRDDYDLLMKSGLYESLTETGCLVPHEEVEVAPADPSSAYKVLRPELVPFVSYPYEWSFGQLQRAALATLAIQKTALSKGMCLRDASAYNVQFVGSRPVLIDTLSFGTYVVGTPWIAYRQFCQHFLAPLALMSLCDVRMGRLVRTSIDGVELGLASHLLPWRSRLSLGLLLHIHFHARSQRRHGLSAARPSGRSMGANGLLGLIDNLESTVRGLTWEPGDSEWADYYDDTNYSAEALNAKKETVREFVRRTRASTVWDLGANTGMFSRVASEAGAFVVAFDIDPGAVEKNWRACRREKNRNVLPLLFDLANPSPRIGWANEERMDLAQRGPADAVLVLALVHHLAISNNVPLRRIASYLARLCRWLVIEFVPKSDSQVSRLLATREDIFPDYTREGFEAAFGEYFTIADTRDVAGSERILYLMRGRAA